MKKLLALLITQAALLMVIFVAACTIKTETHTLVVQRTSITPGWDGRIVLEGKETLPNGSTVTRQVYCNYRSEKTCALLQEGDVVEVIGDPERNQSVTVRRLSD
ncbi:hypothetical protein FBF31_01565 [Candidatus Saccharibacteria bacterium oral taxon 955]|nr:hypothetical protein FBF33_01560 [Candidatus Saccharibacteria bacterium oral taxon 955]QJU05765.1 hypothetical protein FBF31_01565 [Candidatus Saccharibacteria bacterium oral taxon 955]